MLTLSFQGSVPIPNESTLRSIEGFGMSHLKPVRRIEMAKGQLPSEIAGGVFHILPRRITLPRHLIFTLVTWLMLTLLLPMGPLMTASPHTYQLGCSQRHNLASANT